MKDEKTAKNAPKSDAKTSKDLHEKKDSSSLKTSMGSAKLSFNSLNFDALKLAPNKTTATHDELADESEIATSGEPKLETEGKTKDTKEDPDTASLDSANGAHVDVRAFGGDTHIEALDASDANVSAQAAAIAGIDADDVDSENDAGEADEAKADDSCDEEQERGASFGKAREFRLGAIPKLNSGVDTGLLQPANLNEIEARENVPVYKRKLESIYFTEPPQDRHELCTRLNMINGYSIRELATLANLELPDSSSSGKGFSGQLIEIFLGAHASNLPLPDFIDLNIELKTLPVGTDLMPQESTFLCGVDMNREGFVPFEKSPLYHKLKTILFVLLLAPKGSPIGDRRVIGYFFFAPHGKTLNLMKSDYNELMGLINEGRAQEINATMGNIIQMRPKAASAKEVTIVRDQEGNNVYTRPRGYYLRRSFTKELIEHFIEEQGITKEDLEAISSLIS